MGQEGLSRLTPENEGPKGKCNLCWNSKQDHRPTDLENEINRMFLRYSRAEGINGVRDSTLLNQKLK